MGRALFHNFMYTYASSVLIRNVIFEKMHINCVRELYICECHLHECTTVFLNFDVPIEAI